MLGRLVDELASRGIIKKRWTKRSVREVFDSLELELASQGLPLPIIDKLRDMVSERLDGKESKGKPKDVVTAVIKDIFLKIIPTDQTLRRLEGLEPPIKIVFLGFNGVGKSLSIVKFAKLIQDEGKRVLVVSADTYRAAAGDQLEGYCRKAGIPIFKGQRGSDPAAVAYDAVSMARSKGYRYVLIDTAGRNYLDRNLVEELRKIVRVVNPDLKVLVIDGLAGSDVLNQCDSFNEAVGIDALVVTKIDGSGLSVPLVASFYTERPVLFLGTGQGFDDIKQFDVKEAIDFILSS
ncbi:MAG: signal recognition particle-docking protein FtsY [Candidatus Korarchaeota archaeon]|nr:signal recognition particle-docking protein FtsY [Candidatus Korarchaeota archaeon]